jgi:hypothetical protein
MYNFANALLSATTEYTILSREDLTHPMRHIIRDLARALRPTRNYWVWPHARIRRRFPLLRAIIELSRVWSLNFDTTEDVAEAAPL